MKGAGTGDKTLIRIIVSRSEIDLGAIKREFQAIYHKTLESAVKSETGGDYEKALVSILEGN
jgi:annexin A7/11